MSWLAHVKKTMKSMAGMKKSMGKKWFSHVLKSAKKSYHKGKRGGEDPVMSEAPAAPAPVAPPAGEEKEEMGGRRRRRGSKKTRRVRKH
jgi:hypothetical protein